MQGSFAQPTRGNGTAITIVVLMHGAALTALALAKTEVFKTEPTITRVYPVPLETPPPDVPPPPKTEPEAAKIPAQHVPELYLPDPIVPIDSEGPIVDTTPKPVIEPAPWTPPGPIDVVKQPDPPPPEPKKIEPARARANLASYVSDADYPAAAIRGEEQGTARFRLTVGADGRVSGCTITGSSGSSALDSATCRIMKQRARFTPARDSAGNATPDTVSNAIKWVLPE